MLSSLSAVLAFDARSAPQPKPSPDAPGWPPEGGTGPMGQIDSWQGAERSACLSSGRVAFRGWGGEERTVQVVGPGPCGLDRHPPPAAAA